MFSRLAQLSSNDIGIDLGTANTLVYLRGKGVVVNEPSVVAINKKTSRVVAVGASARAMMGRTPEHIETVRPLVEGVISEFDVAEEMLGYFLRAAQKGTRSFFAPRVVIGVPTHISNVEARAVHDAAKNAGARSVGLVEEPMAGAIGLRLPVGEPFGTMVVDIGGGSTDVAILALHGTVRAKNMRLAGDHMDRAIVGYIRARHALIIGEKTAEELKRHAATLLPKDRPVELRVAGRDAATGLPREIALSSGELAEALLPCVEAIARGVREVLEHAPPEVLSDILERGASLFGGGALLRGLPEYLAEALDIPLHVSDDPLSSVARGTGIIVERMDIYRDVLLDYDAIAPETS